MQFTASSSDIKLMEVPLAGPMQLDRYVTVRITVSLKPATGDSDPGFGLTDGTNQTRFSLVDTSNYIDHSPCYVHPLFGTHDNILVPASTPPPAEYTLLFNPYLGYGQCSTAQVGGYVNTATFSQLDFSKGLSLIIHADGVGESYTFKSILVEFV